MKLISIGLDGGCFELIDPWIENGDLPNFRELKENGVYSDMESCLPPVTSPNWKCYSTGKNPGKLGIFWWENIDIKNRKVYYPYHRKNIYKEIWEYLSDAGYRVGVIGTPLTYPPKKVNGFMISGAPDGFDDNFTYPKNLEKKLKNKYKFKVNYVEKSLDHGGYSEIKKIIDNNFRVGIDLWHDYNLDFLQISTFHINVLHHFYWNDEKTKICWEMIDKYVGKILDLGTNVIVMSDHGSNKIKTVFNINSWLEKEGYLKTKNNLIKNMNKIGFNINNLSNFINNTPFIKFKKFIPKQIINNIPNLDGQINLNQKGKFVDFDKSKAIASGQGPIYINKQIMGKNQYVKIKNELKSKLKNIKDKKNKNLIRGIFTKEEIYSGELISEAPDLIMDQNIGIHIPGGVGSIDIIQKPTRWKGENKKHGMFIAYGKNIIKGNNIKGVKILDLAPTILYMMNTPIPKDMDGKIISEIFTNKSEGNLNERSHIKNKIEILKRINRI